MLGPEGGAHTGDRRRVGAWWVPLCHMPLIYRNILVDDERSIVGIYNLAGGAVHPCGETCHDTGARDVPRGQRGLNQSSTTPRELVTGFIKRGEEKSRAGSQPEITGLASSMASSWWYITYRWTFTTPAARYMVTHTNLKPLMYDGTIR